MNKQTAIKQEELDLSAIIRVLRANINAPNVEGTFHPNTCLTKGQMLFLVEILEQLTKMVDETRIMKEILGSEEQS